MNTIRIRRRAAGGAAGAPASLANAELAFNEQDDILYYGKGTGGAGGSATSVVAIGGPGFAQPVDADLTALAALSGTGLAARTASNTWATRTLTGPAAGVAVTNGDGVAGNPTLALANDLAALEALASTGFAVRTATDTWGQRTLTGTSGRTTVSNGDGVAGNPVIDLAALTMGGAGIGTYTKVTVDTYGRVTSTAVASISDLAAPTADVSWGSFKLTGLADPINPQDAASKAYVDGLSVGLSFKTAVRAATTAAITLSGAQTIDGVSIVAGDRVLVKDQASAAANGIYVAASGAWARATDMDAWAEVPSAFTFISEGGTQADSSWVCTSDAGGTLGSTSIAWVQFGSAGSYSAGNGLQLAGSTFSVLADGSSIGVSASGVRVSATYAGQTSITTLGTITTGTWTGTVIGVAYGGLGTTAITGIVKGSGTAYAAAVAGTDYLDPSSTIDGGTF